MADGSVAVPLPIWAALIRMVKTGAELDRMTPEQVIAYADECADLLEAFRVARETVRGDTETGDQA